jgi:hypothetical protein
MHNDPVFSSRKQELMIVSAEESDENFKVRMKQYEDEYKLSYLDFITKQVMHTAKQISLGLVQNIAGG